MDAVRKEFGGLVAVNDVSFQIRAGDIVGLIGPNGAGKSHHLQPRSPACCALTRGAVRFRGEAVGGLASREIARRGVSRTFQHVKMIPEMTVLENVALGGYLRIQRRHACARCCAWTATRSGACSPRPNASSRASAWSTRCTSWPATWRSARSG